MPCLGWGGGQTLAEITISGSAELALDYDSEAEHSKHTFNHQMDVDFAGSGTTDGGLNFGGSAGFNTGADGTDEGKIFVGGAFGTITIGDNDSADKLSGGIADVGLNGIGVDDVVEDIHGTTANQFRYDQSVGNIALAISAGTSPGAVGVANTLSTNVGARRPGSFEAKTNSYAVGMSFNASGAKLGIGYDSGKTISAGIGYSTGQISANAFYAKRDISYMHFGQDGREDGTGTSADGTFDASMTGIGVDVSYTMGASTLTMTYAKTDVSDIQPFWAFSGGQIEFSFASASLKGVGIGFSHDLGGGASLVAGFGQVPQTAVGDLGMAEIGQASPTTGDVATVLPDRLDLSGDKNVASVGLSFSF